MILQGNLGSIGGVEGNFFSDIDRFSDLSFDTGYHRNDFSISYGCTN